MEVNCQLHIQAALSSRKKQWYLLDKKLDGTNSESEHCEDEISSPCCNETYSLDVQSTN
jgi:hypothetical protein